MASDQPSTPGSGVAQHLSPVRALIVLAGFLIAVGVLVAVGTRPPVSGDALPAAVTTTTVANHAATTTTSTTIPHGSVTVVVANATGTSGLAAHYSTELSAAGWNVGTPADASGHIATSTVYYAAGEQQPAGAIAASLGIKPASVLPATTSMPVKNVSGIDVVVVIGADLVTTAGH